MLVGGFGFIGRRFIKKFYKKYDLVIFAKKTSYQRFIQENSYSDISIEIGDITNEMTDAITSHKPDVILHMASLTGLTNCNMDKKKAFLVNVLGTFNVIMGCIPNKTRLVFISSREVYGETKIGKTKEDSLLLPQNVYGVTKMIAEDMIRFANRRHALPFTILRLTNVYGPEGDNYGAQIIIKNALKGYVNVFGGTQQLNFVYVDDVVDIIDGILLDSKCINETFNVGSPYSLTINEFVEKVLKQIKKSVKINYKAMRENETDNFLPDLEKLKSTFQLKHFKDIESGIQKTIEWYSKSASSHKL